MASDKSVSDVKNLQRHKENVLRAIEHLKVRKARPDHHRILYVLNKQFRMDVEDAKDALEQMTDEHRVVRVDYKGSVSYRDAKNWIRLSDNIEGVSTLGGASILNSDRATAAIKDAVKILSSARGSDASGSASLQELEKYFKTHEKFTSAPTAVAVEREVNAGHLARKGPDAFVIHTPKKSAKAPPPTARPAERVAEANEAMNEHGKRVKKTKVIFDPSDVPRSAASESPAPKKIRRAPPSASPSGSRRRICKLCRNTTKHEVVLSCSSCHSMVHPSCMGYSRRLVRQIQHEDWTCMDCKTCSLCTATGGELIFCDGCDKAFHMRCHKPEVKKKPVGEWMCVKCREGADQSPPAKVGRPPKKTTPGQTDKAARAAVKPTPPPKPRAKVSSASGKSEAKPAVKLEPGQRTGAAKKASLQPGTKPAAKPTAEPRKLSWPQQLLEAPVDESVPDASDWSAEDVAAYLCRHGFQPHAAAFQNHQVDGPSLLLMTRMDVLRGLGLKLGPALKIYNHVKLLQTRRRACLDFCLL